MLAPPLCQQDRRRCGDVEALDRAAARDSKAQRRRLRQAGAHAGLLGADHQRQPRRQARAVRRIAAAHDRRRYREASCGSLQNW